MKRIQPVDVYKKPPTAMDEYLPEEPTAASAAGQAAVPSAVRPGTAPVPAGAANPPSQPLDDDFRVRNEDRSAVRPHARAARRTTAQDDTEQISIWLGATERRLLAMERMKRAEVPKSLRPFKEKLTTSALVREAIRRCFGDPQEK